MSDSTSGFRFIVDQDTPAYRDRGARRPFHLSDRGDVVGGETLSTVAMTMFSIYPWATSIRSKGSASCWGRSSTAQTWPSVIGRIDEWET